MRVQKDIWRKLVVLLLTAVFIMSAVYNTDVAVDAEDTYPNKQTTKNTDGVTFTKSTEWEDEKHNGGNFGAAITLKVENLPEVKRQPVDAVLILSTSINISSTKCTNPLHSDYRVETDSTQNKILTDNWTSRYQRLLPDETTFTDESIYKMNSEEFIVPVSVGVASGYLIPKGIYTKESGEDLKRFKKRDNWFFVTEKPIKINDSFESQRLHFGEKKAVVNEVVRYRYYPSAFPQYTFELAGRLSSKLGCNSARGIATTAAKRFVELVMGADKENRIALVSYADDPQVQAYDFSSKKAELDKSIDEIYSQRGGYTNASLPLQKAAEIMQKDDVGNRRFVFFESDQTVEYDKTLKEAGAAAAVLRNSGVQTYAAGYGMDDQKSYRYLAPLVYDYNSEKPTVSSYVLSTQQSNIGIADAMKTAAKAITEKGTVLTVTDYISEYFEVDKNKLPQNATVIQERVQGIGKESNVHKVTIQIPESELDKNASVSVTIPITLKKEFQNTREFINTNHIFPDGSKGAWIDYKLSDDAKRILAVDTPYLQPDTSVPEIKYAMLSYNLQGGVAKEGENFDAERMKAGTKVAEASGYQKQPVKKGFLFGGWYLEAECVNQAGGFTIPETDTIIYAKWVKDTTSVTIDLGGGRLEDGSTSLTVDVPINRPVGGMQWYHYEPKRDGYNFGGWYLDAECKIPLTEDMLIGDITKVFAKWTEKIEEDDKIMLYYDTKGGERPGGGGIDPVEVEPGTLISKAPGYEAQLVKAGFEFAGWYLDEECTVPVGEERMPYGDKIIYAKWEPVNLLSYELQGGSPPEGTTLEPEAVEFEALISSAKGYQTTPVREGYVFKGWYLEAECMNPVGDTTMPDENKTIYAKWEQKEEQPEEEKPPGDTPPSNPPTSGQDQASDKNTGDGSGSQKQSVVSESVSAAANTVSKLVQSVKTGDYRPITVLLGGLVVSAFAIALLGKRK